MREGTGRSGHSQSGGQSYAYTDEQGSHYGEHYDQYYDDIDDYAPSQAGSGANGHRGYQQPPPKAKQGGGGFLCCFRPNEEPQQHEQDDHWDEDAEHDETAGKELVPVVQADVAADAAATEASDADKERLKEEARAKQAAKEDAALQGAEKLAAAVRSESRASSRAASRAASRPVSRAGSQAPSATTTATALKPTPSSIGAARSVKSYLKAAVKNNDRQLRLAEDMLRRLLPILTNCGAELEDVAAVKALVRLLDEIYSELAASIIPVRAKEVPKAASDAYEAVTERMATSGPLRVIRNGELRGFWAGAFGVAERAEFAAFLAAVRAYVTDFGTAPACKLLADRLKDLDESQGRLRWHVDRENKGEVTVMDVDAAFPPACMLQSRVQAFVEAAPDSAASGIAASVRLPERPPPSSLLGRDVDVMAVLDGVDKAADDVLILGGPGLGVSTLLSEVVNRALEKKCFPGGVFYTDLTGVLSRDAAAVALALTLNASRSMAETDVDAAVVAALRRADPKQTRRILVAMDAAEDLICSSHTGGDDFAGLIAKLRSVGPHITFLVGSSEVFPGAERDFAVVRAVPLPQRDAANVLKGAAPEGWEWRVSANAAKEMAQLVGRAPLAVRLLVPAIKGKAKPCGELLMELREARGIKIEGEVDKMCNCDMQAPWDAMQDMWGCKPEAAAEEDKKAHRGRAVKEKLPSAGEMRRSAIAGLRPDLYEKVTVACARLAYSGVSPPAQKALREVSVFATPFDLRAAAAVLDEAPEATATLLERLAFCGLVEYDGVRELYSVHKLVRLLAARERKDGGAGAKQRLLAYASQVVVDAASDIGAGHVQLGKYWLDTHRTLLDDVTSTWFTTAADADTVSRVSWLQAKLAALKSDRKEPDNAPVDTVDTTGEMTELRERAAKALEQEPPENAAAVALYRQVLELQRAAMGGYAAPTAVTRQTIGELLTADEKYSEAIGEFEAAMVTQAVAAGTRATAEVAALHVGVGNCYMKTDRAEAAATEYRLSLDIYAKLKGQDSIECAVPLNALGSAYWAQGKLEEALERYHMALVLRRAAFGEDSKETQDTLANIAGVYAQQKRYKEASDILLKTGIVYARIYGKQAPETTRVHVLTKQMLDAQKGQSPDFYQVEAKTAEQL